MPGPAWTGDVTQDSSAAPTGERIDRGVVALPIKKGVYVGWRLLRHDPPDIAFDVYRQIGAAAPEKVNRHPIRKTTDFLDRGVSGGKRPVYTVRPVDGMTALSGSAKTAPTVNGTPYLQIALRDRDTTFQKVGVADLNGDGAYDYVIKQPNQNIDPW
ncbi:MAG TPA: hypothetical protein ENJ50_07515, partial [Planctomycetaceae bacterium]|nr:hypothetical protein [Planctomycetaceae bacterium]